MRTCIAHLESTSPYSQSAAVDEDDHPSLKKEKPAERDLRLWKMKATVDADGFVCIPAMALKMAVDEAIKRLNIQIAGRGKTTYSKFFVAGQICGGNVPISRPGRAEYIHIDEVQPQKIWANVDGVRGSGKRVKRLFPVYPEWEGVATFHILDEVIPSAVFERALAEAGRLVGIGRFRPEKGGLYGRFKVNNVEWQTL